MINLTKRQSEVLEYLKEYRRNNGISPSMREVAEHFDVAIPTVQGYFNDLAYKGVITRSSRKSRSIQIPMDDLFLMQEIKKIIARKGEEYRLKAKFKNGFRPHFWTHIIIDDVAKKILKLFKENK